MASCGNSSGVKGAMTVKTVSTNRIVLSIGFDANENLKTKKATASVKEYKYDESAEENQSLVEEKAVGLTESNYTQATLEFTGLTKNTKYIYELYVKYNNIQEKIVTIEQTTSNAGESEETAIKITSEAEFNAIKDNVSGYYILENDLDFTNVPLNTGLSATSSERFKGTFDGNGHTIRNVNFSSAANVGLFAYTEKATIKNLILENVVGDFSSGRASINLGALIGCAEKTTVENVKVSNVTFDIQGNQSAEINVGGIVGKADSCTFSDVDAEIIDIEFTRCRLKVTAGLFAGTLTGKSLVTDANRNTILAESCNATGSISAVLYYQTSEGHSIIGGFAGNISSSSLIYDCVANADILVTKDTTSSFANKYFLAVGGFVGANYTGNGIELDKCLAEADIEVYAGAIPTNAEEEAELAEKTLTTSTDSSLFTASVGGFAGRLYKVISGLNNCVYKTKDLGVKVIAKDTQANLTDTPKVLFVDNLVGKNNNVDRVIDVEAYSETYDFSQFGENVKNYLKIVE